MFTQPSKGISYLVGDLHRCFTKLTWPSSCTLQSNPIPPHMVHMAFCDLSHTFHKQVTNISQHVFVILLYGILMSPLNPVYKPGMTMTRLHCKDMHTGMEGKSLTLTVEILGIMSPKTLKSLLSPHQFETPLPPPPSQSPT